MRIENFKFGKETGFDRFQKSIIEIVQPIDILSLPCGLKKVEPRKLFTFRPNQINQNRIVTPKSSPFWIRQIILLSAMLAHAVPADFDRKAGNCEVFGDDAHPQIVVFATPAEVEIRKAIDELEMAEAELSRASEDGLIRQPIV